MKILFRSHSIEKNIARNANAVPCCSLLKDDNERWNSSVRNVMSVSIILSSYGTEKNPNVGSFLGALFAFPCGIFHFVGFLNLRFVAIRWHWNCGSGFNLAPLIWGLPPNPSQGRLHSSSLSMLSWSPSSCSFPLSFNCSICYCLPSFNSRA